MSFPLFLFDVPVSCNTSAAKQDQPIAKTYPT